ncbi:ATP-binding protein [Streptomyces montanisoli]|uniref:ATP-binding protein n=1 Tax=Streptomyces montanisoli TaxID=2798581 RepID=UPI003556269F
MNDEISAPRLAGRQFSVQLSSTRRGARLARLLAVEQLRAWGLALCLEPAAHIVAELAANAVSHGLVPGRDFRLALRLAGEPGNVTLRIGVTDTRHDALPAACAPQEDRTGGRGLLLVTALADRWGVEQGRPPHKTVWAEIDLREPAAVPLSTGVRFSGFR